MGRLIYENKKEEEEADGKSLENKASAFPNQGQQL